MEIGAGFEDPLGNQLGCIHVNTLREFLFVSKKGQKGAGYSKGTGFRSSTFPVYLWESLG